MRCNYHQIAPYIDAVHDIDGAFAEIGVWRGIMLLPMAAINSHRRCYAVDSFIGMAKPTRRDKNADGRTSYPKGALSVGGHGWLDGSYDNIVVVRGWVPNVLQRRIPDDEMFAFIHIDLDHYLPTYHALKWAWSRLVLGGIVAMHDWFPASNKLASGAAKAFMRECECEDQIMPSFDQSPRHLAFRKGYG